VRDLPEVLKRLRAADAAVLEDRIYPNAEGPRIVFVRDPDGELIQLVAQGTTGAQIRATGGWYPIKPHLKLTVGDLDRSIRFYRDVLGLAYEDQGAVEGPDIGRILGVPRARFRHAALWKAGFSLLLRAFDEPAPLPKRGGAMNQLGFTHLSFHVPSLPAALAAARAFPVEVMDDTIIVAPGATDPTVAFLRDPDGQLIEAIQI
jgi:catechol 2,3-dioxygenase-like lactoylglutathione lyase family enzyme